MSFSIVPHVSIKGMAACVPSGIDRNEDYDLIDKKEVDTLIKGIGVSEKRIARQETCCSDLCYAAAVKLMSELKWAPEEIECLVFITQGPDYSVPPTSAILQERLGLSEECYTQDISMGCAGWVYGLNSIAGLMATGRLKKGLLLVGDTTSKGSSRQDKTEWLLFGDAGTATALHLDENAEGFKSHLGTDGSGWQAICVQDGGCRNILSAKSFIPREIEKGVVRKPMNSALDGMAVFYFGITRAPESVKKLLQYHHINKEDVDCYTFHQANMMLNETIRKKLKIGPEKVPYSLQKFGNTSCASIVVTLVTERKEMLRTTRARHVACGFGVGLSWGSVYFETDHIVCPDLIEI